jgi:type IV pilus assembly protein PilM
MGMFAFGGSNSAVGVDIGNSAVKIVQLKKTPAGIDLINYGMMPLPPNAVADGSVSDPGVVSSTIKEILKSKKIKVERSFASISGQNVIMRFTKLPIMSPEELEQTVRIEAEQYVPYAIDEVSITHAVLKTTDEEEDGGGKYLILLVVAQKEFVNSYTDVLSSSGIKPEMVDVDTIAAINALENSFMQTTDSQEGGEVVAIIDCGARTTSISILKSGVLMFTRNIPKAGNDITKRIADTLNYETDQAESVKASEDCSVVIGDAPGNEIGEIIRPEIEDLATEIRMSFDYFKAQSREPIIHRIILSGGSANLKNFNTFLMNELGVEVDAANPLEGINIAAPDAGELYDNLQQFTVAIGLALRGVVDE